MPPRQSFRTLSRAGLVFLALSSASGLSACGGLEGLGVMGKPPTADRPCDLPNQEPATELPPQDDMTVPLGGDAWAQLQRDDLAAYNLLFPRYNANIKFARERCVARKGAAAPVDE